ncbi:MAG TPA: hypothetical protein PLA94_20025, partial [Myxococcota bacterium]|nr:hypothetical protein [Myxococcota bacterium]
MQWRRGVETTLLVQRALPEPEAPPMPTGPTEAWKRAMELAAQKAALRAARAAQPLPLSLGGNAPTLLRRPPSDSADPTFLDRRGRMGRGGEEEALPPARAPRTTLSDRASPARPSLPSSSQTKTIFVEETEKSRHQRLSAGLPAAGEGLRAPPRPPQPVAESPRERHHRRMLGLPEGLPASSPSRAPNEIREATPPELRRSPTASSSTVRLQRGSPSPGSDRELPSWTAGRFRGMVLRTEQA